MDDLGMGEPVHPEMQRLGNARGEHVKEPIVAGGDGATPDPITVQAEANPTEDPDKVQIAVQRVLGPFPLEKAEINDRTYIRGSSERLEHLSAFQELLRKERIRDAARRVLLRGTINDTLTFFLNKQVAYAGHASFCQPEGESPLGPIRIQVRCSNPRKLAEWLAPKTKSKVSQRR